MVAPRDGPADPTSLRERAESDPTSVSAAEVRSTIEANDAAATAEVGKSLVAIGDADPRRLGDVIDGVSELLEHRGPEVRNRAALALRTVARTHSSAVVDVAGRLVGLLDDEYRIAAASGAGALAVLAAEEPEAVLPAIESLPGAIRSDLPRLRDSAVAIALAIAEADPAAAGSLVDPLVHCIEEPYEFATGRGIDPPDDDASISLYDREHEAARRVDRTRHRAALAVARVADADPDAVLVERERIAELVTSDRSGDVRMALMEALATAAEGRPRDARDVLDPFATTLEAVTNQSIRTRAMWALGTLAEDVPGAVAEAVEPRVGIVVEGLSADDPGHRGAAVGLLAYLAEERPAAASEAAEQFRDLLADDRWFVRANAVAALGYVGDRADVPRLQDTAGEDPSEDVRSAAARALARIEGERE